MALFFNADKANEKDLFLFTKGMYYLLSGKINLVDALNISALNHDEKIRDRIRKVKVNVEKGVAVNRAFEKLTDDREFLEMIKIGEETGNLEIIFKNLYEKYEFRQKIKKEIRNLSIYPATVMLTAVVIVFILLKFVVPKFVLIYSDIGQELPALTKIIIKISQIADRYGAVFFVLSIFLTWIFLHFRKRHRKIFEKYLIRSVFIGNLYKQIYVLNFTRNMQSLTSASITIIDALRLCINSKSEMLNDEVKKVIKRLEKGENIEKSFRNLNFFNREYVSFLNIGEKTGKLDISFSNLNEIYYGKVDEKIKLALKFLEPFSIIFIGIIIGVIVFAVMLPVFKMGEML